MYLQKAGFRKKDFVLKELVYRSIVYITQFPARYLAEVWRIRRSDIFAIRRELGDYLMKWDYRSNIGAER